MKKLRYRIPIFIALFAVTLCVWYILSARRVAEEPAVQIAALEEPTLPVLRAESCGRVIDVMHGCTSEMHSDIAADTLILLPEDRKLPLRIDGGSLTITGVRYEIRSADLQDLIERTEVDSLEDTADGKRVTLPIQDILKHGTEYRLDVTVETAERGDVHYYGRIAYDDTGSAAEMLDLAETFSERNFDYNEARNNTMFLESNESGDNTTLGFVNLKSNFTQLTYGNLHPQREGEADLRLVEYSGQTGVVTRSFLVSGDDGDGDSEQRLLFEVQESFVLRRGPERLYMMDYTRTMHEIFLGAQENFSSGQVLLDVSEDAAIQTVMSEGRRVSAFVSAGDLWLIAADKNRLIRVWSFRSGTESGLRANYAKHGIRILSLTDDGDLMFLVYGYMNRGRREGRIGISLFTYRLADGSLTEQAFFPSDQTYDELKNDVETLSYRGQSGIVYLKCRNAVYALDLQSGENVEVCGNLKEGTYAVDEGMDEIAWQDTPDRFGSATLHFMDLDTGTEKQLNAAEGELLRPIGFIGRDLAVGIADRENVWNLNGIERELPFTAIEIVDGTLTSQTHYEQPGVLLTDVGVTGTRIHLTKLAPAGDAPVPEQSSGAEEGSDAAAASESAASESAASESGTSESGTSESGTSESGTSESGTSAGRLYTKIGSDTIVCNEVTDSGSAPVTEQTELREKTYYCELPQGFSASSVQAAAPKSLSYESSEGQELGEGNEEDSGLHSYEAYGNGAWLGRYESAGDAVEAAYSSMGYVRTEGSRIYFRASQASTNMIRDPQSVAADLIAAHRNGTALDLYGAELRAVFYFVSSGRPVLGWSDGGVPLVIYGYDASTVFLYNVSDGSTMRPGIAEAEAMFGNGRNDFCCLN